MSKVTLKHNNKFKMRGFLNVYRTEGDKKENVFKGEEENIVLDGGKRLAALWLAQGSAFKISKMAIGNGNITNEAPAETEFELQNELSRLDVTGADTDEVNHWSTFSCSFNSGGEDFNGADPAEINEACLVMSNGVDEEDILFSKKNFSGQPFAHTGSVTLTFVWRIWVP